MPPTVCMTGHCPLPAFQAAPPPDRGVTLQDQMAHLNPLDTWAVSELNSGDEEASVAQMLQEGTAIAVSDGSHCPGHSTSAFILTRRSKKGPSFVNVRGSNVVPGNPQEQDSYRAELGGVMGIAIALQLICSLHRVTHGSIEIGLDGESA